MGQYFTFICTPDDPHPIPASSILPGSPLLSLIVDRRHKPRRLSLWRMLLIGVALFTCVTLAMQIWRLNSSGSNQPGDLDFNDHEKTHGHIELERNCPKTWRESYFLPDVSGGLNITFLKSKRALFNILRAKERTTRSIVQVFIHFCTDEVKTSFKGTPSYYGLDISSTSVGNDKTPVVVDLVMTGLSMTGKSLNIYSESNDFVLNTDAILLDGNRPCLGALNLKADVANIKLQHLDLDHLHVTTMVSHIFFSPMLILVAQSGRAPVSLINTRIRSSLNLNNPTGNISLQDVTADGDVNVAAHSSVEGSGINGSFRNFIVMSNMNFIDLAFDTAHRREVYKISSFIKEGDTSIVLKGFEGSFTAEANAGKIELGGDFVDDPKCSGSQRRCGSRGEQQYGNVLVEALKGAIQLEFSE